MIVRPVALTAALCCATACSAGSAVQTPVAGSQSISYYDMSTSKIHAPYRRANPTALHSSWMATHAAKGTLLYLSSEMSAGLDIYSFPQGKLVGQILGFSFPPQGICSDAKGNVFVPEQGDSDIIEFPHGSTTPIATLQDPGEGPSSCSVDSKSGDLAVANVINNEGGAGNVVVYKKATGDPVAYTVPNMTLYYECGYDTEGDLFADGYQGFPPRATFVFGELAAGQETFKNITIDRTITIPGVVQWDGSYMAVGDASNGFIYRIDGPTGNVHSTVVLSGAAYDFQPTIQGHTIVAPSFYTVKTGFWKYPAGGSSFKNLKIGSAFGATVSVAAE